MKYEWRKQDKQLYLPKQKPIIETFGDYKYIVIEGQGNPNSKQFASHVEALYALSYGIKMAPKQGLIIEGYYDYTVFPLEGYWDLSKEGQSLYQNGASIIELKDYLVYQLMIRQPEFVSETLVQERQQAVFQKKQNPAILDATFEFRTEGLCCQMLHIGPYDNEPETFQLMEDYIHQQGYRRRSKQHKEIYISDPRKTTPEKMKTTLRIYLEKQI